MLIKRFRYAIAAVLTLSAFSASAQDKIYMTDGSMVQAKVKEVGPRNIVYTRWDNKDGAEYVVVRREVDKIVYENGTEETFGRRQRETRKPDEARNEGAHETMRRKPAVTYGNNIISLAPIQMTNESASGVGVAYERSLDKSQIFSLYLPVAVAFYNDQVSYYNGSGNVTLKKNRNFTYVYPGLKIYPAGSSHRVSYSVGPSFGLGFGDKYVEERRVDSNYSTWITYKESSVFKAGFIINNGLNIQPTKAFYVGLEFGFGIFYYNNETNDNTIGNEPMVQFNFKMGYRF